MIRSGESELYPEIRDAELVEAADDAVHLQILRGLGFRSAMVVPFVARGRILGALTFVAAESGKRYAPADLALAEEIARRTAAAIDNSMLHERAQAARRAAQDAADRAARLQAITAALSNATTVSQIADVAIEQGIPALGTIAGSLSLLSDDGSELVVVRDKGYPEELLRDWRRIPLSTSIPITDAVKTGEPVFLESRDAITARYPHLGAGLETLHDQARAAVPLMAGGRALGALAFIYPQARIFTDGDRAFLLSIAQQCAQAIERARLYERERHIAETLQRAFLPAGLPELPGVEIHAAYVPGGRESEIGGDWYDVFRLPDGRIAMSVGDVVGRGLQAAVLMGQTRQTIRAAALDHDAPVTVLVHAGRVLHHTYETEGMATAVFGIFDPAALTFTYATAGHPPPLLALANGHVEALASGGLPLGVVGAVAPPSWTISVPRGSLLVLYTDGLVESTRNIIEGEKALFAAIHGEIERPSSDPARAILDRAVGGVTPSDDVAIITVRVAVATEGRFNVAVPAIPSAGRDVRLGLRWFLAEHAVDPDRASDLQVAVGEAVNNVVEHAYGAVPGTVYVTGWRDGPTLTIEVRDEGRWRAERHEGRGHGIRIMRALVDAVEIDSGARGTTVTLVIRLSPPHTAAD